MGNDIKTPLPRIVEAFDEELWKAGVDDGAFAGILDTNASWYALEIGGEKIALANAVPGPGDLTTVSYYVAPAFRNQGYGTKLAEYIVGRHEKASFVIKKDNEASVKVALAALRGKFAATMGRHVVRLTKEAAPLSGGLAEREGKKPSDFDPKKVEEGRKVEMEHTDDPAVARKISLDHLTEDVNYYKKLKKIEKKAVDLFGHPLGSIAGGMAGQAALGSRYPFAAPIGGAILGGQIAKAKFAPKKPPAVKEAIDPMMLGLGAAATALTTMITAKQIKSQMALTQAVQKTQAAKKALIAALAGAGAAGAVGGYALGKKSPEKSEKTTVLQPIVVTPDEVPMKTAGALEALREHVKPMLRKGPWLKAYEKKPGGKLPLTEALITDSQASGAGK